MFNDTLSEFRAYYCHQKVENNITLVHGDSQKCLSVVYVLHVNQMFLHVRKHETPRLRFKLVSLMVLMYFYNYLTCCRRGNR